MFAKEEITFSPKNISIPNHKAYIMDMVQAVHAFLKRVRWRVIHHNLGSTRELSNVNPPSGVSEPPEYASDTEDNLPTASYRKFYKIGTHKNPPHIPALESFEADMHNMVKNIKTKNRSQYWNPTIEHIHRTQTRIRNNSNITVPADKTLNTYSMNMETYNNLILKELNKNYKTVGNGVLQDINLAALKICSEIGMEGNVEIYTPKCPRFTLKDHKPDFSNNPSIRLISPCISDMGVISKKILDRILPGIKRRTQLNLWTSSEEVLSWYKELHITNQSKFIMFDIDSYYPSISSTLLEKALTMARNESNITNLEMDIIRLARRTLISYNDKLWTRKDRENNFDITMGAPDSAQVTDLVGIYILREICMKIPELAGGLYRDDALFFVNTSIRNLETKKKKLNIFFSSIQLSVTMDINYRRVNFLDITLDLCNNTYEPYHKPNHTLYYIDAKSNHPPMVKRAIIPAISSRISKLSKNQQIFDSSKQFYNEALNRSGYKEKINYLVPPSVGNGGLNGRPIASRSMVSYNRAMGKARYRRPGVSHGNVNQVGWEPVDDNIREVGSNELNSHATQTGGEGRKKNRRRTTTWFNPPYSQHIKTNIPKIFYSIVEKNFPRDSRLGGIINKNTVKLSYSTCRNIATSIIGYNNSKITKTREAMFSSGVDPSNTSSVRTSIINNHSSRTSSNGPAHNCNCRASNICPLGGNCRVSSIVYKCDVITESSRKSYIGSTGGEFKDRFRNHMSSFRGGQREDIDRPNTSVGRFVRNLIARQDPFELKWSILGRANKYKPNKKKRCNLCALESYHIMTSRDNLLNARQEILQCCLHRNRYLLSSLKPG